MEETSRSPRNRSKVVIIGAGPIGLECAAWCAANHVDFVLFEQGEVAEHLCQWGQVELFSPFFMNHSDWGVELLSSHRPELELPAPDALLTGAEYRQKYLLPLSQVEPVARRLQLGTRVISIGKSGLAKRDFIGQESRAKYPFRLLLRRDAGETVHLADAVIDASGVYSSPQSLGDGNIPALGEAETRRRAPRQIHYHLVNLAAEPDRFAGRKILLVGAGHSAATHLEVLSELAPRHPGTRVFWVTRKDQAQPYEVHPNDPLPYRDRLSRMANRLAAQPPPWLRRLAGFSVQALGVVRRKGENLRLRVQLEKSDGMLFTEEFDQILACVGYQPDTSIYRQLQVHECYATQGPIKLAASLLGGSSDCLAQESQGLDVLRNPEPNFFIVGNKSYGTNSNFLLTRGIEQVDSVMQHLIVRLKGEAVTAAESGT